MKNNLGVTPIATDEAVLLMSSSEGYNRNTLKIKLAAYVSSALA